MYDINKNQSALRSLKNMEIQISEEINNAFENAYV